MAQTLAAACAFQPRSVASSAFAPALAACPRAPSKRGFSPLSVQGPMARSVGDVALFLDAMAAHAPNDPLTQQEIPGQFQQRRPGGPPPKAHRIRHGLRPWRC